MVPLVVAVLALSGGPARWYGAEWQLYHELLFWNEPAYATGTSLGALDRPSGPVRRVAWHMGEALGGMLDDWEQRFVLEYDTERKLARVERWDEGARTSTHTVERNDFLGQIHTLRTARPPYEQLWSYDDRGRPLRGVGRDFRGRPGTIAFTYEDRSGHMTKTVMNGGTCYEVLDADVDERGRIVRMEEFMPRSGRARSFAYDYDEAGRLTLRVVTNGDRSSAMSFEYDTAGHLSRTIATDERGALMFSRSFSCDDAGSVAGALYGRPAKFRYARETPTLFEEVELPVGDNEYTMDEHGNWILRSDKLTGEGLVRRDIEYYE